MPVEKIAPDVCNWMNPLVALECHENDLYRSYQDKDSSPLPEGDLDFRSHLLTLGGMELCGDN